MLGGHSRTTGDTVLLLAEHVPYFERREIAGSSHYIGPSISHMSDAFRSEPSLRQLLYQSLPSDSDLEAFCLDYFPDVYRRYSSGMERQAKLSLLLLYAEPKQVRAALAEAAHRNPILVMRQHDSSSSGGVGWSLSKSRFLLAGDWLPRAAYLGLAIVAITCVSLALTGIINRGQMRATGATASVVLRSTPAGAEVWDLHNGRSLGTTPLIVDPRALPFAVCLRNPGFQDEVLSLPDGRIPQGSIALRPVGSSPSEVCDVPIPILP